MAEIKTKRQALARCEKIRKEIRTRIIGDLVSVDVRPLGTLAMTVNKLSNYLSYQADDLGQLSILIGVLEQKEKEKDGS